MAIEADGIQHGRHIAGMQKDFATFERQQDKNLWKLEEYRRRGITLYKLTTFDLTQPRFEPFIRDLMKQHGWYEQFRRTTPVSATCLIHPSSVL